ncbi:MAG: carboxypeptidase-like regulatory domain-containing protein, partial [Bacteroidota bacterium]
MRASFRFLALFGSALLLLAPSALAQTTGKIAGTVLEAGTGEPLPGVNVFIEGTTQGTSTNINGEFVIIGVRPGTYTIVASFVGFANERREGVQVSVDLTSTIDFRLREEVFEGEEVIVTAEASAVKRDVTSSEARITSESIDRLPVQEVNQVLNVQAGITEQNGGYHIRGGRTSEVTVMVDGVPVTDSYDGSTAIELENDGIQELQVISGTFNAEYGNAMSGIINVVTKEGRSDRFGGSVEVFSGSYAVLGDGGEAFLRGVEVDEFTSQDIQYRDVDVYSYLDFNPAHYYNLSGTLEGPVLSDRVTFFGLGRYFKNDGWLYGTRLYSQDGSFGDSSLVSMNTNEKLSWQGNLRVQVSNNMILNVIGLGSWSQADDLGIGNGRYLPYRWNPDGIPTFTDIGYDLKLKFTHLVNNTTFYTLNLARFSREQESARFDNPLDPRYNGFLLNPPDSVEVLPGVFEEVEQGGNRFLRGGMDLGRFNRNSTAYFAKGDLTSQVSKHHLVKIGAEVRIDNLDFESFGLVPAIDENGQTIEPFQPARPPENSVQVQAFEDFSPITISAYVQDKIEFENFIVNAGLRFDYFDSRAEVPADPEDPNIFNPFKKTNLFRDTNGDGLISPDEETDANRLTVEDREAYWWRDTEAKFQLSPRLGVAYPITE